MAQVVQAGKGPVPPGTVVLPDIVGRGGVENKDVQVAIAVEVGRDHLSSCPTADSHFVREGSE